MAQTVLVVGAGKMGGALLKGWLDTGFITPRNMCILDPNPGTEAIYAIEKGAKHLQIPQETPPSVRTVLLAIKPQIFGDLAQGLGESIPEEATIISILAGTSLRTLRNHFKNQTVIRTMPNTPAAIGAGISAVFADPNVAESKIELAESLLKAGGKVVRVDSENALNAVTAVSGSGPAYVFRLVETLEAAARDVGLPPEIAAQLAKETIIGAAKLMEESSETPAILRKNVTSPNGTTQAALDKLMAENGLSTLMTAAVRAAFARAKELAD